MKSQSESYKAAGVDITAGYQAVELMKKHIAKTLTAGAVGDIGMGSALKRGTVYHGSAACLNWI